MNINKILPILCAMALLFAACKKEDPAASVYLKKLVLEVSVGGMTQTIASDYTWQNNLLISEQNAVSIMGMSDISTKYYEYEGSNIVHTYNVLSNGDTILHWYFTYENGRLKTYTNEDTHGVITSYNADGQPTGFEDSSPSRTKQYKLEWKDGDMVKATLHATYADGTSTDTVYTYTYDNKPSAYSNMPLVMALNDAESMAMRASRHNLLDGSSNIVYKNDRLVQRTVSGNKVSYYYTDGIGPDTPTK